MKKKEITKIPYRTAQLAGGEYTHVDVAFTEEIKGAEHLFVEIYKNDAECLEVPYLRFIFTKEDWGSYAPATDHWSKAGVQDLYGSFVRGLQPEDCFMSDHDQDIVWTFCGETRWTSRKRDNWEYALDSLVDRIRRQRREKKETKRKKRLDDRIANTPELPEDLEEWADKHHFQGEHFLYYKRHGRYADIACSACGKVFTKAVKRTDTFEGRFEPVIQMPKHGERCRCPECGAFGTWKSQGKMKSVYRIEKCCFIGQPYKGTGAVVRCVEIEKKFFLNTLMEGEDEAMIGAGESYSIIEIARMYLEKGKKPQTDFHKYSPYTGENFWDDCNLCGMNSTSIKPGYIYERSYQMLKGTILQYSAAKEFGDHEGQYNMMDYMQRYLEYPQIEMLAKLGLYKLVDSMVRGACGIIADQHAEKPEDFLGIKKSRIKLLIQREGDTRLLEALQKERKMAADWTEKELNLLQAARIATENLGTVLEYTTMQKLVNKLEKYSGCKIPDTLEEMDRVSECGRNKIRTTADTYFDYLNMRRQRGYDLHNTIFLYPKNLRMAHDRMAEEINGAQIEKRDLEVEQKYPDIKKNYRKLRNRYFYEDADYLIRPARSASEITREGRILHHCVGGNGYLEKHNTGKSIILFLRTRKDPEEPYITVEIEDERICQWYGAYDRKPDEEQIKAWLKEYTVWLKEERMKALTKTA